MEMDENASKINILCIQTVVGWWIIAKLISEMGRSTKLPAILIPRALDTRLVLRSGELHLSMAEVQYTN